MIPQNTILVMCKSIADYWHLESITLHLLSRRQTSVRSLNIGDVVPPVQVGARLDQSVYNATFSQLSRLQISGSPDRKQFLYHGLLTTSPYFRHLEIASSSLRPERCSYDNTFSGVFLSLEKLVLPRMALATHGSSVIQAIVWKSFKKKP